MTILETRGLRHRYGSSEILKGINLAIQPGETVALIGPSGAGKSTLLRLLDLLEPPTEGSITIAGEKVGRGQARRLALRRKMAFVHQKPLVFSTSVFDNVAQGLRWRGIRDDEVHRRVTEALAMVRLDGFTERQAKTLSGGETQRVALARALATEPDILFLDEPTANLDPQSTALVEELVSGIIRRTNLTVVMTTHDFAQGQRLAGRIGVMMKGELLQLGKSDDIFMAPASRAVAEFIGIENILDGSVIETGGGLFTAEISGRRIQAVGDFDVGDRVNLFVRPEDVTIAVATERSSARNRLEGTITRLSLLNPLVRLEIDCGFRLMAVITRQSAEELGLAIGQRIIASLKTTAIHAART
jgi:tungstate transport system ATP-binding protein